jgi:hypothetical protein
VAIFSLIFKECLKMGSITHNYEVRLMAIIGLCISDLLLVDLDRSLNWLQAILEPYLAKLAELAQLKALDKAEQSLTCHLLNLLTQLMSSLIQRQKTHMENMYDESSQSQINNSNMFNSSTGELNASLNTSKLNQTPTKSFNNERKIVNSILVKLLPIYKLIISRNLPSDLIIIDVS